MRRTETLALGLLHGPVELLPVSSSGHVAAIPWLLGWEVARDDGGRRKALAVALHAGTAALAAADRARTTRVADDADWRDGLWLGLAQCAALWPGVSRSGVTLAVARARGFARPDASRLSWEVGLPVLIGAAVRTRPRGELLAAAAAFASTVATAKTIGLERRRPLWPWAAWRIALAAAVLAVRQNRARD